MPQPARRRRGASLIDLLVVLLILAIISSVGMLKYYGSLSYHWVQRTAERIRADFETARHNAKFRSQTVSIAFDVANNRYTITGLVNPDHPGAPYIVNLAEGNLQATLSAAAFGGDSTLIFNEFGMADSSGTVTLVAGSSTQTVTVAAQSGAATVP